VDGYKLGHRELDGLDDKLSDSTIDIWGDEVGEIIGLNEGDSVGSWRDEIMEMKSGKSVSTSDGVSVGVASVGNAVGCFERSQSVYNTVSIAFAK
jgi:hypothetical protein